MGVGPQKYPTTTESSLRVIERYLPRSASCEAIVFGSALQTSSRVQINIPRQQSWSTTAAPYADWVQSHRFPLGEVMDA